MQQDHGEDHSKTCTWFFIIKQHIKQTILFVPRRSTTLQLLRTMDDCTEELINGKEVDIVYIDFQKAFDSVPHQKLLGTIANYGIQGKTPNWIRDLLFGRKQRVVVNGSYSKWATVKSGIPQSLVIGPVLFIVFIN